MRSRLAVVCLLTLLLSTRPLRGENWPGWRGPRGDGSSQETNTPYTWDGETGQNILWKVRVPGEGHGSPTVWGNRLFLVTCLPQSEERVLLCLDRQNGKTLWQRTVLHSKLETKHSLNSYASSTPATDGKFVYATFLQIDGRTIPAPNVGSPRPVTPGAIVVAAYDLDGNEKWKVEVGEFVSAHGFCSNPVIFDDLVVINGDHDGDGYLVALDRSSGEVRWRSRRENGIRSYATPIIREIDGRTQMVLSGSESVVSYDPRTGRRHWTMNGPTEQFVASMVFGKGLFFLTAGYPEHHIMAIRPDGAGDVTETHVAWRTNRGAAYVPSPVLVGRYLVVVSDTGIASCFEAATGKRYWMNRIGTGYSASLVTADGFAYAVSDEGVTTVLRPGPQFQRIAECKLGEPCSSSPAISNGNLFIRGQQHLFCIGGPADE